MSMHWRTWSRTAMASVDLLELERRLGEAGMGSALVTDPRPMTITSYPTSYDDPSGAAAINARRWWSMATTRPVTTRQCGSARRRETTTWRASTEPDATSGRNG